MKKFNYVNKIKNMKHIKLVIGMIIGILVASTSVFYAATIYYDSVNVGYDNTASGLGSGNVQGALDDLCNITSDNFVNRIYPIGSIYISTSLSTTTDVANALGGTWEVYGAGRTLIGVGTGTDSNSESKSFTVNSTGGEYNHTLTTNQMPSHNHTVPAGRSVLEASGYGLSQGQVGFTDRVIVDIPYTVNNRLVTLNSGSTQPHNNIQPYITVYMYKRIS